MKRLCVGCAFLSLLMITGCGGDPRETDIQNVLGLLEAVTSDLDEVKRKIADEAGKDKIGETERDAIFAAIDKVKDKGKKLSDLAHAIQGDAEKRPPTEEERKGYANKFGQRVKDAVEKLDKSTNELLEVIATAEAKNPKLRKDLDDIKKKFKDAQSEFQQILRRG